MPDITFNDSKGVTHTRHITSSQQRLMSKMKWEQIVRNARARKEEQEAQQSGDFEQETCPFCAGTNIDDRGFCERCNEHV